RIGGDQREVEAARLDPAAHARGAKAGDAQRRARDLGIARAQVAPWHFLNFLPLPHGHGSLRPTLATLPGAPALPGGPTRRGAGRAAGGLASGGGAERSGRDTARGASPSAGCAKLAGGGGSANLNTSSSVCASIRAF